MSKVTAKLIRENNNTSMLGLSSRFSPTLEPNNDEGLGSIDSPNRSAREMMKLRLSELKKNNENLVRKNSEN